MKTAERRSWKVAWVSGLPKGLGERKGDVRSLSPSPFPPETPDTQATWKVFSFVKQCLVIQSKLKY